MHLNSVPITQLAEKFKVSRPTIYHVIDMERRNQNKIQFYFNKKDQNKDNMEHIDLKNDSKLNFLGVTIDTENGSSNPKINKALNKSFKLHDMSWSLLK
jgi:hypothetical protein